MLDRSQVLARFRAQSWLPAATGSSNVPQIEGQAFPAQAGATLRSPLRILCLAPGDWLIVSREHAAASLRQRLEPALASQGVALVDVTDALPSLEVHGPFARDLLAKGCGLDMHRHSFVAGRGTRTRFAHIPVVIECLDDSPRFELSVARSYFDYLHAWLKDAALEFGGRQG